ncbi:hypothetical protein BJ878DRAFT_537574 [Calycina marina]|uniref:HAUS augmin-like complex subunit 1 n=1 Tax=Calycina marina TaxID=1763456 RepID=A0A9P7ZC26_9HELO|nr:hypothetical protein BJ878DRAFT_537574 [Calycina marina]
MSHHLSPAAIFSPSLARLQATTSKDWAYIDAWLSSKLTLSSNSNTIPKIPPFERTPDTLRALLALAAFNEAADEEQGLLASAASNELSLALAQSQSQFRSQTQLAPENDILANLEAHLTPEGSRALETLASLSQPESLNVAAPDTELLGRRMINLQITANDVAQASERVAILEAHLNKELERLQVLVGELQSDAYQGPPGMGKESVDYQRKTKVLAANLPELQERIASLTANARREDKISVQDVKGKEERFKKMLGVVKDLEKQVKSYHGLPQDTDLARLQLESVRVELQDLTRERDAMFEGLVERESPKKTRS